MFNFLKNNLMKKLVLLVLTIFSLSFFSCKESPKKASINIIPEPVHLVVHPGNFELNEKTRIVVIQPEKLKFESQYLADIISKHTGFKPEIVVVSGKKDLENAIVLRLVPKASKNAEGYQLKVEKGNISILAPKSTGIFYGIQSLLQLFPPSFFSSNHERSLKIPRLFIQDAPRFPYRGMHLDVSRHFFPPADIKRYIDMLAMYKFNTFHWHLTDDQGWRIEIKKYPKLTEIGGWRDSTLIGRYGTKPVRYDKKRYGGFYTQDEIRNIVKYAAQRHITIIPEIEMPGHSSAALAAYPGLACTPGPFHVATTWGVFKDIYCPKEKTFHFLENVLTEVMALFPSKYIHIGGDEVPKARWKESKLCQQLIKKYHLKNEDGLQSWFIGRIGKFLNAHGRKMIGWDEILEGGLSPHATVMSWRGIKGGIEAAEQNHDVIMAPGGYCYFDHYQANRKFQPLAIGGFTTLKKVYSYEPVPKVLNAAQAKHILGAEGCVWTEYIPTFKKVQYMVLPRMAALAEVNWTPAKEKNWPDFQRRIHEHFLIYKALGYNYCPGSYKVDIVVQDSTETGYKIALSSEIYHPEIRYTLNDSRPSMQSKKYYKPFVIPAGTQVKAAVFLNGKLMEVPSSKIVH